MYPLWGLVKPRGVRYPVDNRSSKKRMECQQRDAIKKKLTGPVLFLFLCPVYRARFGMTIFEMTRWT